MVSICAVIFGYETGYAMPIAAILALLLGLTGLLPVGGSDMPVVISTLNSFSGLAASAAGFIISNSVLVVAGCLVGTSGMILTVIMCKSMNRSLVNILFGGYGKKREGEEVNYAEPVAISVEDTYFMLEAARDVVIVPGYGMAVAQAQHAAKELSQILEANGATVRFAIHPVAGRMPGHMNVLLAEANVDYDKLVEMDVINGTIQNADVAVVIGANDVVNTSAADEPGSPIYGMPIINVHLARSVIVLKRGKGAGFSGLRNKLFSLPNVRMLYGDARKTLAELTASFKN
jgi:NAD(P) transhydrogenase subunit beta